MTKRRQPKWQLRRMAGGAFVLAALLSIVTACGGGGGGGSSAGGSSGGGGGGSSEPTVPTEPPPTPPPPPSPTPTPTAGRITGHVVAGPVRDASVAAFCHDTDPARDVGSTTSTAQGDYALTTTATCTGLLELRVSGGHYVDEATGTAIDAPTTTWLRALLADGGGSGASRVAQITVMTELLYQRSTQGGAQRPTAGSLQSATQHLASELQSWTGSTVDVMTTAPSLLPGTSASDAGTAYSLLLAALSRLSNGTGEGVADAVATIRDKGFGLASPLSDALRFVASSPEVLLRIGVDAEQAAKAVVRAESYVAVEALLPLTETPDSSGLSCDPLKVADELGRMNLAQNERSGHLLLSTLSQLLSLDANLAAMQAWKSRCPALGPVALDLLIGAQQPVADQLLAQTIAEQKPLRDCANINGVVNRIILRGTGRDLCVGWDGTTAPEAFVLSSTQPAVGDDAMAYGRCVELSEQTPPLFGGRYAVFVLRGTSYLFCGKTGGGFYGWLDRQNTGYYDTKASDGGGNGATPPPALSYDELAALLSRSFVGKDADVRMCSDSVDGLFPTGLSDDTEPVWPQPYSVSVNTGVACANFGADSFAFFDAKYKVCMASFAEADYEAVGRRGYATKVVQAQKNLERYYNLRRNTTDPNRPLGYVCGF